MGYRPVDYIAAAGAGLIALGLISYIWTDSGSATALIPLIFGTVFVFLGRMTMESRFYTQSVLGTVILAFLGLLTSLAGLLRIEGIFQLQPVNTVAAASQLIMLTITLMLLAVSAGWLRDMA